MENRRYDYSPIIHRPRIEWPDHGRIALWVAPNIEYFHFDMPLIIKDLHADLSLASWIALVYALVTASLYLPCGRLSDVLGVGKLFLVGFVLYSLSAFAAGMAAAPAQMIFFRATQAAGSALIMANNFALITALFPREERGRAM